MDSHLENILLNYLQKVERNTNEIIWANVFHDAINGCSWLSKDNFSINPGRWAVGYNYFYVVFRLLNEWKPKAILELGLGQSSKLIGQYVKTRENLSEYDHLIIEHDKNYAEFMKKTFDFSVSSKVSIVNIKKAAFNVHSNGGNNLNTTTIYDEESFAKVINGKKFDFISVDAPYGDAVGKIPMSRVDLIKYLPDCLNKSFCIVIDDFERQGEQNTVKIIKNILMQNNIKFSEGIYSGSKDLFLLASEDLSWLCTM